MVDKFACSAGEGLADDCPCQGDQVPVAGRCAPVSVVLAAVLVPSSLLAAAVVWLLRKVREERERHWQTLTRRQTETGRNLAQRSVRGAQARWRPADSLRNSEDPALHFGARGCCSVAAKVNKSATTTSIFTRDANRLQALL